MRRKYGSLAKNVGLFAIGNFGPRLISFALLPLYTSILSASDYGTVDLLQSTSQLLVPLLLLSIQDATFRFGMDDNYKKSDVISTAVKTIMFSTAILFVALVVVYVFRIFDISTEYLAFLFLSFVLGALNTCFNFYLRAKDKAAVIAVGGILCTLVTCVCNILFLIVFNLGVLGYMLSLIMGLFVQFVCQLMFGEIYKDIHVRKHNNLFKEMVSYSGPLVTNSIAWWVNNVSDRYVLTYMMGVAANGVYAIAYKIPSVLTMLQNVFCSAWSMSAISEYDPEDKDGFIGNNYTIYGFISVASCSVLMLLNIPIARLLYTNEFFLAWTCVPLLLAGAVFNGISSLEGPLFSAMKKTKEVARTTAIGALVNLMFNFVFIYMFGIVGAALATMVGYLLTWHLRTRYLKKAIKMKVDWKRHYATIIVLLAQTALATFGAHFIFQIPCLVLIVFLYRKYLAEVLKKLMKRNV